jgi:hypothetical protein
MGFWMVLYYVAVIALTAYSLRQPKTPTPKPASLSEFDVPQAKEGKVIPVAFGTVDINDINIVWYGDLVTKPIRKGGK